ncbi:MAG TPA: OmpA family protein [Ignavibacteria bacterium]|nr:OmpA family protein [Ignavibacteria bacterium]
MAVNLLELAKSSLTPDIVSKLSGILGEDSGKIQSAVKDTLPAIIGSLMNKTSTDAGASDVLKLLKDGGYDGSMLSNLDTSLLDKNKFFGIINGATNTLGSLFGDNLKGVTNLISKDSGVSSNSASSILGFLSAIIMSLIGKQVTGSGMNSSGLTGLLSGQKGFLAGLIPAGIGGLLGLAGLNKVTSNVKEYKEKVEEEAGGFKKFLPWLLLGLGALLLFFLWKSCNKDTAPVVKKIDSVKTDISKKVEQAFVAAPKTGDVEMDSLYASLGKFTNKKLADGTEIIIAEKGVEFNLISFIEDKSKMADKETWFSFDRILFETNKSTLKPSSALQLVNIAAIMKAYPNVEIKIGGYTDNTGNPKANLKLSDERANSVMSELVKLGVSAERMKAEGYGDQFPVASNDTPEGRAKNRRIDVRVSKK